MKKRIKLTFMLGLMVLLPIAAMAYLVVWTLTTVSDLIHPIVDWVGNFGYSEQISIALAFALILGSCFTLGLIITTKIGKSAYGLFEKIARKVPGYGFISETTKQLLDGDSLNITKKTACRVYPTGRENASLLGFVIESLDKIDSVVVFCPTAPVPTSGYSYIVSNRDVDILEDVDSTEALRVITLCGTGTQQLFEK
ncbi:DUF502 domain-containing protein [Vibrio gallicus]|uniref:DUF502 domain-containing protein n=1 Tax=Vibrio gallicus TaxID=190897 RepID=UPI0021C3223F|nr:DUF502 domain-containing protein [Vibrio gallicus]